MGVRFDILDYLLSKGLRNTKVKGDQFICCCPFHGESNPSFGVSISSGQWICRASNTCGLKGNITHLVSRLEKISYSQAAKVTGTRYRSPVTSQHELNSLLGEMEAKSVEIVSPDLPANEKITELNYPDYLKTTRGYGVETKTYEYFDLRVGTPDVSDLYRGKFAGYLIFPVFDYDGKYLAFTGRYMGDASADNKRRYDAPSYPFRDYLYGEWLLDKSSITPVYVVEGQFDVHRLITFGESALGTFGTSYTDAQVLRLCNLAGDREIVICYDADTKKDELGERGFREFGEKSTPLKLVSLLRSVGKKCCIMNISGTKDVDEMNYEMWLQLKRSTCT